MPDEQYKKKKIMQNANLDPRKEFLQIFRFFMLIIHENFINTVN